MKKRSNKSGFSLVELMVVVAVVGLLAALAIPRFKTFQAKAAQSEAKGNLTHIYTLQQSYHSSVYMFSTDGLLADCDLTADDTLAYGDDNGTCNQMNALGFEVADCVKSRYQYTNVWESDDEFDAQALECNKVSGARAVFPGCTLDTDEWEINENKQVSGTPDMFVGALHVCTGN